MSIHPLTEAQRAALAFIAELPSGKTTGYDLKVKGYGTTATLNQLARRGYVVAIGQGHTAFPANGLWQITQSGRDAV